MNLLRLLASISGPAFVLLLLSGCTSQIVGTSEQIKSAYGSDIKDLQKLYLTPHYHSVSFFESKTFAWIETQKEFENGDRLHTFTNPYRDCTLHWITDTNGMIKSGSFYGKSCSR
ncbi:hypothetical protein [Psychromonas sp. Urea-02u-13]|uniref:hypothetical protein n=1 Tax=Psychromonas sp. Urea-02u-13 TaxID=2058326 RepID=UPI000C34612E|nr:hypothetical protein [Psychromonas sp. Urea-02u-13]PKG37383.1 hypothetical protein CXF74_19165 [Psychromonas sp. Urea-02u-13]